jgi:hypothetical protein
MFSKQKEDVYGNKGTLLLRIKCRIILVEAKCVGLGKFGEYS